MILVKKEFVKDLLQRFLSGQLPTEQEIDLLDLGSVGTALKIRFKTDGYLEVLPVLRDLEPEKWFKIYMALEDIESEIRQETHLDNVMRLHEKIIKE